MSSLPSPLIENYLREAGFWHVANIGRGCKGQIEMSWLQDTFLKPGNDSTKVERVRYTRAYILKITGGYLMLDLSRNLWSVMLATLYREMCGATKPNKAKIGVCPSLLQSWARFHFSFLRPQVNQPYTFPLIMRWNHSTSYVGIPTAVEDIRLLLDQWSEAHFQWTTYENLAIRTVIPVEFFQNPNIWHVKVPLIKYLACTPDYMLWFRIHGKPYLLLKEQRRRQIRDDGKDPSTVPTQSPGPMPQATTPILQPLQIMPGVYLSLYMYPNPYMFSFPSPMSGWIAWSGASPFLITPTQSKIYRPSS
ncbi:hypothetical protein GOBAR_AA25536 [Gossypium barbadense]|uniref:Aminotransferase-like plant mobile domain-containing protein n=1 Tax=Gossypium barbadense TaxID=3634 RepID=A0A2P5WVL6_GOSBA|nr:hypothetical protein GOBAR_AA25536 [Gossypium barbadense]